MGNAKVLVEASTRGNLNIEELEPPKSNYVLKMDLRLIPILGCTYTILFLDRTNSKPHCQQIYL